MVGCESGPILHQGYVSPRITGRVLDANTRQPIAKASVLKVNPRQASQTDRDQKGAEWMIAPTPSLTDEQGRFTLGSQKDLTVFRHANLYSVSVTVTHPQYVQFVTNFTLTNMKRKEEKGPLEVEAGDLLLRPRAN